MENQQKSNAYVPSGLAIVITILVVGTLVKNILYTITEDLSLLMRLGGVSIILSCIFSMLYCLYGYKKDAAKYFKMFCVSFSISLIVRTILNIEQGDIAGAILAAIAVICLLILAFAKDLGKTKSYTLCGITFAVLIANVIVQAVSGKALTGAVSRLIIGLTLAVMIHAKYKDKESRGSK